MNIANTPNFSGQNTNENSVVIRINELPMSNKNEFLDKILKSDAQQDGSQFLRVDNKSADVNQVDDSNIEKMANDNLSMQVKQEFESNMNYIQSSQSVIPNINSSVEESVLYMLKAVATGYLSYEAKDPNYFHQNSNIRANLGGVRNEKIDEIIMLKEQPFFAAKNSINSINSVYSNSIKNNTLAGQEIARTENASAIVAFLVDKVSPYLKRHLVITHSDSGIHIILRDYFLSDLENVKELELLLKSKKEYFSDSIKFTINGKDYEQFMKSLEK